mmetsp:Transcript_14059/g.20571  ORF Transcript_14059/g.20571 Transcript_14059/m.20571 type:complete len:82 (-) Transcript_14059:148-393(-)
MKRYFKLALKKSVSPESNEVINHPHVTSHSTIFLSKQHTPQYKVTIFALNKQPGGWARERVVTRLSVIIGHLFFPIILPRA